ncbi:Uncharacterised protein [Legionella busanensis]|uniref:Uncharacterized protein n=1 Tax=Legionella busanensis TaxID=190655 RepID=A0A378JMZ4_9GAMM|nr:hypothetical protein [Legionella busanensis]STX52101.1 Uncharacterised protein [Legionella busanensis]
MTQRIIKENLALFLDYRAEQLCKEIAAQNLPREISIVKQVEIRRHVAQLKDFLTSAGKCFALSVAEAAFSETGYGPWWKTILVQVATWKPKDFEALNKTVELDHLLPKNHQSPCRTLTLGNLFEMVLNEVATEHAQANISVKAFLPEGIHQVHYFDPSKKIFELMINGELLWSQSRDIIGGYFPTTELAAILKNHRQQFPGNICLGHGEDHAINVSYKNGKWVVYNPNYSHETIKAMTKSFDTEEQCVGEIKLCLRNEAVALQFVSFRADNQVKFDFFDKLNTAGIIQLIENGGLHIIARNAPAQLQKIIELAFKNPELATALSHAIFKENKTHWSGLLVIARYAPNELENLFSLAQKDASLALGIAKTLTISNNEKWNALHMIASQASNAIEPLLNLAKNNNNINRALHKALSMKNKQGNVPIDLISKNDPNLSKLLTFQLLSSLPKKSFYSSSNHENKIIQNEPQKGELNNQWDR